MTATKFTTGTLTSIATSLFAIKASSRCNVRQAYSTLRMKKNNLPNPLPFAEFLHETSNKFLKARSNDNLTEENEYIYHVIMGNEAGDCDSIISSLALAYVYSMFGSALNSTDDRTIAGEEIVLPICSINRQDMVLRRETTTLLRKCNIDPAQLLYLDDDPIKILLQSRSLTPSVLKVTLTDHNKIRSSLDHLSDNVVEIVDHHSDELSHMHVKGDLRNVAFDSLNNRALVGSACTLVSEYLLTNYGSPDCKMDDGISSALLGTIILDTMNMSESAGKGTDRDKIVIDSLKDESSDLSALFNSLNNAKFDSTFWNELSALDCLRIDFKEFYASNSETYGIASVLLPLESLLSKPNFASAASKFTEEKSLDILSIMSFTIENEKPKREMLLFGKQVLVEDMSNYLAHNDKASSLDLTLLHLIKFGDDFVGQMIHQNNIRGSRKQVAPLMIQKVTAT